MTTIRPIRTTLPGAANGIFAWTDEDIRGLRRLVEAEGTLWQDYIRAEAEDGFITNAMNEALVDLAHRLFPDCERLKFPGYSGNQLQALVVDFRFACFAEMQFEMWFPRNAPARREKRRVYLRARAGAAHRNGVVEWTIEQLDYVIEYLMRTEPEFWQRYLWRMDEIGFVGHLDQTMISRLHNRLFSVPQDLDSASSLTGSVIVRTDERFGFRMFRPENGALKEVLWHDYMTFYFEKRSFDDWLRESPLVKAHIRTSQPK